MSDTKEILAAIGELRRDFGGRLDAIERKLKINRKQVRNVAQAQALQQEQIDELRRRLDELSAGKDVLWRSADGRKIALDKEAAYRSFAGCGISRRQALLALRDMGLLLPDQYGKMTAPVQTPDRRCVRAVVILNLKEG